MNLYSNNKPRLLEDNVRLTRRFEDLYFSPDELLNKYFSKEEINTMKNDPAYFRKVNTAFTEEGILRKRELKEVINCEINDEIAVKRKQDLKIKLSNIMNYYLLTYHPLEELKVLIF